MLLMLALAAAIIGLVAGGLLAPGFVDVQVNGGAGALFNDDPSLDTVRRIAVAHRRYGTTGLLPTVVTDTPEIMHAAADAVTIARREGITLEQAAERWIAEIHRRAEEIRHVKKSDRN